MATIQGIYVALFGRPADPAGLAYFNAQTNNGANLTAIGDLASTAEYQARFDGLNNVQIVTRIYQELFGRDPDAAGLAFFVAALNSGTQTINTIAINILDGAQGADAQVVANKVAAANLFTAAIDTPVEVGSYVGEDAADLGRAFLAGVTADAATVPTAAQAQAAVTNIVETGVQGNTIVSTTTPLFTVDSDSVISTTAAAGLRTTNNNDTITISGDYDGSAGAAGSVNGGLGTDTLNISVVDAQTPIAGKITSIERLFVTSTDSAASLTLTNVTGLQQVWAVESATNLALSGIRLGTTIGLANDGADPNVATAGNVSYSFASATGTADAATLAVQSGVNHTGLVTVNAIETLTISVQGPAAFGQLVATDAKAVNVTGTGDLTITLGSVAEDATIDASGHVGAFVFTSAATDYTVVGGASNDVFNLNVGSEGVVLTGGAGNDLFSLAFNLGNLTDTSTNALVLDSVIQITDFSINDVLDLNLGVTLANADATTYNAVVASNIANASNLSGALALVGAESFAQSSDYAVFQYQGSTYVYVDNGAAGFSAGDTLVQLVGYTGELNSTNFTTL